MRNLILITSEFPYFSGETFLQNEIPFLSKVFKNVYIFSINGSDKETVTRTVASNVRIFPLNDLRSIVKYLRNIMAGLISPSNELSVKSETIKHFAASLYTRGRAYRISKKIFRIIQDEQLDIQNVTVYSFWFAYQSVAAWLLADKLKNSGSHAYTVSRAHGYDLYWERVKGGFLPFQDASLRKIDMCFPCSDYGKEYLLKKYPWAKEKIETSRLGTNDYGLNPYNGEITLVTCCNLEPLKRIRLFAEAFCKLAKDDKRMKWICIGAGEEKEIIEEIIDNAGVNHQVEMTGRLPNEKVMEIYKTQGIMYFCNVSETEGVPVSIMEAMSFGIPIIATDVGGTSELLSNDCGVLLESNISVERLEAILLQMIQLNNNQYNKLRNGARIVWKEKSDSNIVYKRFCDKIS